MEPTASTVNAPAVPEGFSLMTPLEMNAVRFNPRHTVLTPELIASLARDNAKPS